MYSILINTGNNAYQYYTHTVGAQTKVWTGSLDEAKAKVASLLNAYTINKLVVVHNTTIDLSTITITDITA